MAKSYRIFIWKKASFLRLLIPVITGILIEYYAKLSIDNIIFAALIALSIFLLFHFLPLAYKFKFRTIAGIILTFLLLSLGMFLLWNKNLSNHADWYGNYADSSSYLVVTIKEPLIEKNKSCKAIAQAHTVIKKDSVYNAVGKLLLYISKDSVASSITYGSKIIIKKKLQEIKNSGNPAAFDFKGYCARQQIFYQCYLQSKDWILLKERENNFYDKIIFTTRAYIIHVIDTYITGNDESSVAKALIVGDRVDLDKDLVQAYSNAGVIHIIVIAGLHLGLIYALLFWITGKISFIKKSTALRFAIILICIWFFTLLTGAASPVLRAAVMFSFIAISKILNRKTSVYNSLAVSAFVLLCINPYSLWDAGFQLSYLAVTSIAICYKHIYYWMNVKPWVLRKVWEIIALSLSVQVLTLPAILYYFHQMPLLFIISNIIAVPLAIFALYGCLFLIIVSFIKGIAVFVGKVLTVTIYTLNHSVLFINDIPFSVWNGFSLSVAQTFLLYVIFIVFLYWLLKKNLLALRLGVVCTLVFALIMALNKWSFCQQKKMIVYNVYSHKAISFINGNSCHIVGDSELITNGLLKQFNINPSLIFYNLKEDKSGDFSLYQRNNFFQFCDKRIVMMDSVINYTPLSDRIKVDYIVISKNPRLYIPTLAKVFDCNLYIFDASNPSWKIEKWKKDCEDLHLHFYSVPEQGAFVIDL